MSEKMRRRDVLRTLGITMSLAGSGADVLSAQAAQHVHGMVEQAKPARGPYKPRALTAHEYATLQELVDLILPASQRSKGALAAGAAEFIDFLCSANDEMAAIYTGGLGWLDREITRRHNAKFKDAQPAQQTALLDLIAYKKNASPALNPGIEFFTWARNMTVDAYYSSRAGIAELGFMGNGAMSQFSVPVEAVQYALKRSNL
jgi:gluconate 2-dehydrogenase gamma chain